MVDPFEDERALYHVLVNAEGQHSLWPTFVEMPQGWMIAHGSDTRSACIEFVNRSWTDMRPKSLGEKMDMLAASSVTKVDGSHTGAAVSDDTSGEGQSKVQQHVSSSTER